MQGAVGLLHSVGPKLQCFFTKALAAPLHAYCTDGLLYHVPPNKQLPFHTSG